jgi:hypothetical protein
MIEILGQAAGCVSQVPADPMYFNLERVLPHLFRECVEREP